MHVSHSTAPGLGDIYHLQTRNGERFGIVNGDSGARTLLVYGPEDPDTPAHSIVLDGEEADHLAELLHSPSLADRLAEVERRLAELTRDGKPGDSHRAGQG